MQITNLSISSDKSKINLTITDAASVVSLRLWDDTTYKDFGKLIDLASKLTGASTETIEITPSDIGITYFDGIYFVEAEDPTETSIEYTYELSKYQECITVKAAQTTSCTDCNNEKNKALNNVHALYRSLLMALDLRSINDMLSFIKTLDKYCTNTCQTCGQAVDDISSYENSNPDTIDIIVDGGSLD